jgi:hypothetical protein
MPVVRFDVVEGRSEDEIRNLLEAAHARRALRLSRAGTQSLSNFPRASAVPILSTKTPGWQ